RVTHTQGYSNQGTGRVDTRNGFRAADGVAAELMTDPAADAQAGLGTRNVEVAGAVDVANADVLDGLRLGDDNRVSRLRASGGEGHGGRAEDKALDAHD